MPLIICCLKSLGGIFLFCQLQVASPYISGLIHHLESRFRNLNIIGAFSVLGPRAARQGDEQDICHLQTLAKKFIPGKETLILQEWQSFKEHMRGEGVFKVSEYYDDHDPQHKYNFKYSFIYLSELVIVLQQDQTF